MKTPKGFKKVRLIDLVNTDVKGLVANIIRQGGKFHYDYQDNVMLRELESVRIKKEKHTGHTFLYWSWTPEIDIHRRFDCGYSGISMNSNNTPIKSAYIFIKKRERR